MKDLVTAVRERLLWHKGGRDVREDERISCREGGNGRVKEWERDGRRER